jgi:PAS domain S-box-containing protein
VRDEAGYAVGVEAAHPRKGGSSEIVSESAGLAAVLKQLPAGVVLAEIPGGRILLTNHELERVLGHGLLESPNVSQYGRWGAIHDDGTPYAPREHPLARVVERGEVIEHEEVRYRRPDGDVRVLSVNASPIFDEAGQARAAVATFIDVTERKRAESAQSFLAQAGRLLASSLDVRQTLQTTVDLAAGALTELAMIYLGDAQDGFRLALGHPDPSIVARLGGHAGSQPLPRNHPALEVIRTGTTLTVRPVSAEVFAAMTFDAAHATVFAELGVEAVLMVPLTGRERVQGAFGFVVTRGSRRIDPQLRATAEELGRLAGLAVENAQLFEQVESAKRLRDEVMAVVSHDLRNPLNVIALTAQGLREQGQRGAVDPRKLERALALTEGAAARMKRLVDDLLDVQRLEARRFTVERRFEVLSEIVEESTVAYRLLAEHASVSLRVYPPPGEVELRVFCDRGRILQVLGNLLDNAIKYTPPGGEVELAHGPDGAGVRVVVVDGGEGIAPEHRTRVFERFWQGDTRRAGTGLGLSIVKGIVEAHGGRIWVESPEGRGAAFHVWLPTDRGGGGGSKCLA